MVFGLSKLFARRPKTATRPFLPPGQRIYAVGDIHGRSDLLAKLLAQIEADAVDHDGEKTLIFLGDYVDRGADSKGVLEILSTLSLDGFREVFLKGNHDQAMVDFLEEPAGGMGWLNFGGDAVLLSYGVGLGTGVGVERLIAMRDALSAALPEHHVRFLRSLTLSHVAGSYLFAHAGIRPGIELERQVAEDLCWIREEFLNSRRDHGHIVVHGHTVVVEPEERANRIGIDTGAYRSGRLTCLVLEDERHRYLRT